MDAGPHRRRRGAQAHARDRPSPTPRLDRARRRLPRRCRARPANPAEVRLDRQQAFGYAGGPQGDPGADGRQAGEEAIGSMGNDARCRCCPNRRSLLRYFKQLFAQVTNPPIDPIREELVMSPGVLHRPAGTCSPSINEPGVNLPPIRLEAEQPVLTAEGMEQIRTSSFSGESSASAS